MIISKMDRRCKTKMCVYGSCRSEFYVKSYGGGKQLYCSKHRAIPLLLTQRKYRKSIPDIISKRNDEFRAKNPNYMKEYYLKRKTIG